MKRASQIINDIQNNKADSLFLDIYQDESMIEFQKKRYVDAIEQYINLYKIPLINPSDVSFSSSFISKSLIYTGLEVYLSFNNTFSSSFDTTVIMSKFIAVAKT